MISCFEQFFVSYDHGIFKASENGTAKGLALFYPDPNAMYKDLMSDENDGLVRARYEILSANTQEYLQAAIKYHNTNRWNTRGARERNLPIVGQIFGAQYNPNSGFMLSNEGISWGFEKVTGSADINAYENMAYKEAIKLNRGLQTKTIDEMRSEVMGRDERDPFREFKMDYLQDYRTAAENIAQYADFMDCYVYVFIPDMRKGSSPQRVNGLVTGRDGDKLKVMLLSHMDVPVFGTECIIDRSADACSIETLSKLHNIKDIRALASDIPYAKNKTVMTYPELTEYIRAKRRGA